MAQSHSISRSEIIQAIGGIRRGKNWSLGIEFVPRMLCLTCGNKFYAAPIYIRRGGGKYCSNKCAAAHNGPLRRVGDDRSCLRCGSLFHVPPSRVKRGQGLFCSKECHLGDEKIRGKRIPRPTSKRTVLKCLHCRRLFIGNPCAKYCSIACRAKGNSGAGNWNWKGGRTICKCSSCGKKYTKDSGSKGLVCSLKCWGAIIVEHNRLKGYTRGLGGRRPDLKNRYFRSRWEANWARFLNTLIRIGEIKSWEYEPKTFEFSGISRGTRFYTPDFRITRPDGSVEWHEVKGYMDRKSMTRLRRMAKYHPEVRIVIIDSRVYQKVAKLVAPGIPTWEKQNYKW